MEKLCIALSGSRCGKKWSNSNQLVIRFKGETQTSDNSFDIPAPDVVSLTRILIEQDEAQRDIRRVLQRSQWDLSPVIGEESGDSTDQRNLVVLYHRSSSVYSHANYMRTDA